MYEVCWKEGSLAAACFPDEEKGFEITFIDAAIQVDIGEGLAGLPLGEAEIGIGAVKSTILVAVSQTD